jgi:TATA-box binding protein (TBP) (component of TFIID and TFIIIB)
MIDYINIDNYNMDKIPEKVSISTMSFGCNLGTSFNMKNIYDHLLLSNNNIIAIKSSEGIKALDEFKSKFKSTNKNSKKNFYNQNTIIIRIDEEKFINIKLFKNGSLQMSGCKSLFDVNIALYKLITRLSEKLTIENDDVINEITFVENIDDFRLLKFKIDFINCNFAVNYLINKTELYKLLIEQKISCMLSPNHACVNIKHKISSTVKISIFVFQTGNIIITGAKIAEHIKEAYVCILKFLKKYKQQIKKRDISKLLTVEELEEIFNSQIVNL